MLSERFTILELTDLALRVPEIGAVNFNILHTILTTLIIELGVDRLKPPCHIQDETIAQAAITKARVGQKGRKPTKILTVKELKQKVKSLAPEEASAPEIQSGKTQDDSSKPTGGPETSAATPDETTVAKKTVEKEVDESKSASPGVREVREQTDETKIGQSEELDLDQSRHETKETEELDDAKEQRKELKDEIEIKESKDTSKSESKDVSESVEPKDVRETEEDKIVRESKETKDMKETEEVEVERESAEPKEVRDSVEPKDVEETEKVQMVRESKEPKDAKETEKVEVMRESEEQKTVRYHEEPKDVSESKETKSRSELEDESDQRKALEEEGKDIAVEQKILDDDTTRTKQEEMRRMTVSEIQETARELMEQSADAFVEKVAVVADALKILQDDELLDSDPARVMEEVWRATNINRRMEAAEEGLRELSSLVDVMLDKVEDMENRGKDVVSSTKVMIEEISKYLERIKALEESSKTLSRRIEESEEKRAQEILRVEGLLKEVKKEEEETKDELDDLRLCYDELSEKVVCKDDLEETKTLMHDALEQKAKDIRKLIREIEDTLVKKEEFMELVSRVEDIEATKVSRDELGRLLEPGFIDGFLNEQVNLRTELEELKITVSDLGEDLNALKIRIEEEIVKTMESNFADIHGMLDDINAKLSQLDPDEINDSFANLEEQVAMIIRELDDIKAAYEQFQKEAKINFNKISNVNELLNRMDQTKADKAKMYELLDQKADIDMLMNKLDRSEFAAVVGDMKDELERLTITVKINEDEMNQNFLELRADLALKMYTEDFITATEPMRNRIKALIYELQRVKQISLTHLFPDAPGIVKCMSCNRGAHMAGPKYLGDARVAFLQEVPPKSDSKTPSGKFLKYKTTSDETADGKLPPIDLDSVPIPPPDKPREKDALRLPVLFASAQPNIGLAHEKRRSAIDKKLAAYFATRPVRACGGEYTLTSPQQRGIAYTTVKIPQPEKEEVLLSGIDGKIYKGIVYDGQLENDSLSETGEQEDNEEKESEPAQESAKEKPLIKSLKEPRTRKGFIKPDIRYRLKKSVMRECVSPSIVSLHVDGEPIQKPSPRSTSSQSVSFPSKSTI